MSPRIAIAIEEPLWRDTGRAFPARLRRAARAALTAAKFPSRAGLTILLAGDEKLRVLNARFRGQDKPTNVLSFPSPDEAYLGDIAIAHGVTAREAEAAAKPFEEHAVHLAVHGVLHLLGYDHETAREARIMEPLEIAVLGTLGIADPYIARRAAAD